MGFMDLGVGKFRCKCDDCGRSSGDKSELELGDEGWTWYEIRVSYKEGGQEIVNKAFCPDCKGDRATGLDALEEVIGNE